MASLVRLVTSVDANDAVANDRLISVSARHEAELEDGRRVLLLDDRGWSESGPAGIWRMTSVEDIALTARTVVGPDEPYSGRTYTDMAAGHWATLAGTLRQQGVAADAAELERLPHDVVLGKRLLERLAGHDRGGRGPIIPT